jgi:hypothetical protein
MCSVLSVITDVLAHQAFQMPFIETDRVVKQSSAAVADPTLGNTVLPWNSETDPLESDANFSAPPDPCQPSFRPLLHGSICCGSFGDGKKPEAPTRPAKQICLARNRPQ